MKNALTLSRREKAGFTLLEMVITIAIFLLLAGAVFGIITGVLQSVASLHDNQTRRDQIAALHAYLAKKLADLPADSNLVSYRRGDGDGLDQNGIIFGGANFVLALDATIQPNGYYTLRLGWPAPDVEIPPGVALVNTFKKMVSENNPRIEWTPLIEDVKTLHWKFQDFLSNRWADQWDNTAAKPNLVELAIQQAGNSPPVTMDIWLPPLTPASLPAPQAVAPISPTGTPTQPVNTNGP